ncbi:hypothetical protein CUMW_140030 [Citrus unshiu]|nr:hypothetical protein CUMW_140030 [Citrus unshiu]
MLVGKVNPSLLDLKHLSYLDLSYNDFQGVQIPRFICSMGNLRYLNLSYTQFVGMIPPQLGNLSNLQYLDLSWNFLYVENLWWLPGLSFLKDLDLSYVNLSKASDWLRVTNTLPSLVKLRLSRCQLHHLPPLAIANFSTLTTLDLLYNQFDNSFVPNWVFGLIQLVFLDLRRNNFQGPIPEGLQNLTSLKHLLLDSNRFNSSIPNWLYRFNRLESLGVSNNSLQGRVIRSMASLCNLRSVMLSCVKLSQEISEIFDIFSGCVSSGLKILVLHGSSVSGHLTYKLGQFKNLYYLDLSNNSIVGPIPFSLGHLSTLQFIDLSYNELNGMNDNWIPPFQLATLGLRHCHLGSRFPSWLYSQKHLNYLDLSYSGIIGTIPNIFWSSASQIYVLDLSFNQIHGQIPNLTNAAQLEVLSLGSNSFSIALPLISSYLIELDFSNNSISGSIFHFICYRANELNKWQILYLSGNFLQGELPDCWMNYQNLMILDLSNNKFTGNLPISLGSLISLQPLHLRKNNLCGTIHSLENCIALMTLDVGENELVENIPTWIRERFSRIVVLILRSNKFYNLLPKGLCDLAFLQIVDLADNNLSGEVPRCIHNLRAMVTMNSHAGKAIQYQFLLYASRAPLIATLLEDAFVVMKGREAKYERTLNLVRIIDFSKNNFSGKIPLEVTNLKALQSFNLSNNFFTGRIPESIGAMRSLESIDFSLNQLSGEIPQSMSSLKYLNHLNLSNNNLTGKIPSSTQLQSFDASSYAGNDLCGAPLPRNCSEHVSTPEDENGDEDELDYWLYVSIALGFMGGFWCLIGPLLASRRWRYKYYNFLDRVGDRIVFVNIRTDW